MKCFELIKLFIDRKISIDDFYRKYFFLYRIDVKNQFDGELVKVNGEYIENTSEFLSDDPKLSLLAAIFSYADQLEDMDFFEEDKTYTTKLLTFVIICWIYHFEFEDKFINISLKNKLEPEIFSIIKDIDSIGWDAENYISLIENFLDFDSN